MSKNLDKVMANIAKRLMTNIQMGISYHPDWSEEFAYEEVKKSFTRTKDELVGIIGDINDLSVGELEELGFKKFTEEDDLLLIPLWIYNLIEDGTELISINGEKVVKGEDKIDLDVRFGCIAYGING